MQPAGFERLAQHLLREADFDSANVTPKSGDGRIDELGVYRLGLVSFLCRSKIGFCVVSCVFLEFMRLGRALLP